MQTLDLEFDEYCRELLQKGMDPIYFLRVSSHCRFVWDACRKRCADLCKERDLVGMATAILKNEDGTLIDKGA